MNGVQNVFQAVQIAPPQIAVQAMPAIRLGQPVQRGEPSKALPAIVVVSSAVSVDWNIEGKSPIEIATLKPKLLAAIAKGNLDGKELFQKFTPEQEDEIFEITKIDIRNGDSRSMFSTAMPSPRTLFVGFLPESDSAAAMKSAFQSADKMASQLATAGNLKLGKIESVHVQVSTRSISANSSFPVPSYQAYPSNSTNLSIGSLVDWEPTIPTGEIRMDSLNQLKQNLNLSVRYRIE